MERSRTDPSLLVITYNSEHNHPWPTQRNALAGSTRSHHAKNSKNNPSQHNLQKPDLKAEPEHHQASAAVVPTGCATTATTAATSTTTTATTSTTSNSTPPPATMAVKEEAMVGSEMEKGMDHDASVLLDHGDLMQQMFSQSYYRPMIPEAGGGGGGHHADDFFADLAELESDPMSLIFPGGGDPGKEKEMMPNKSLGADPLFGMLDWGATNNGVATSAGSSFEQDESGW